MTGTKHFTTHTHIYEHNRKWLSCRALWCVKNKWTYSITHTHIWTLQEMIYMQSCMMCIEQINLQSWSESNTLVCFKFVKCCGNWGVALLRPATLSLTFMLFLASILFCRDGGEAAIFNAKGGVVSSTLKAQHPAASIQAVEISSQYLLLFCR